MLGITHFPQKETIDTVKTHKITRTRSREFKQDNDTFDPSISSSPPNDFMEKLTKRYNNLKHIK